MSARLTATLTLLATTQVVGCAGVAEGPPPPALSLAERQEQRRRWSAHDVAAQAELALASEQPALAASLARQALLLRPGWAPALALQARACVAQGDLDGALDALRLAAEADPTLGEPLAERARLRADQGDSAGALEDFRAAAPLTPGQTSALLEVGLSAVRRDPAAARDALDLVLAHRPEDAETRSLLAALCAELDDEPRAIALLASAPRLEPFDLTTLRDIARARRARGYDDGAREVLDLLLRHAPDDVEALADRAWLQAEVAPALADAARALALQPGHARASARRGWLLACDGALDAEALADLEVALADEQNDLDHLLAARLAAYLGRTDVARRHLAAAPSDDTDEVPEWSARARAAAALGDLAGEAQALDAALLLAPADGDLRRRRGDLRAHRGDLDGALADLDLAIALAIAAGDRRAEHLARRARSAAREAAHLWPGALADALACTADDRTDVDVVDRTARVWWALGERAKARECEAHAAALRRQARP